MLVSHIGGHFDIWGGGDSLMIAKVQGVLLIILKIIINLIFIEDYLSVQ